MKEATHERGNPVRTVLWLLGSALVTAACSAGEPAMTQPDAGTEQVADDSDPTPLPVDPAVRIGTLDNGLTYYLRSNDKPGSALSVRLVVNAGSVNEPAPGLGVAHFLEHMMFRGTENFPGDDLNDKLRRIGVELGPDLNAYTSYDETVYSLDLSIVQPEAVQIAFEVLSQWAHAATLDLVDISEERGVVRDELRTNFETADGIIFTAFDRLYTADTRYEGYLPIGTQEGIEATTQGDLRAFYEDWYVPSNMAVVAVGDLPLDDLEYLVVEHFDHLAASTSPTPPDIAYTPDPAPVSAVVTSPGQAVGFLSLDIPIPTRNAGTVGGQRLLVMDTLVGTMLADRLGAAYERGELSQVDAPHWEAFDHTRGLRYYGTNLRADDLAAALTELWSVMLTVETHGFIDAEFGRAVGAIDADLQFDLDREQTTSDTDYAAMYVAHFLAGADIGPLRDRVDRVSALLDEMSVADLSDHYRTIMKQAGPLLIAVGNDPDSVPTAAELDSAIEAAGPGEPPEPIPDVEQLVTAPDPIDPVSVDRIEDLDAYEWSFANGARVMFIESGIAEGRVDMLAVSQGGWTTLDPGDRPLAEILATQAVSLSGLGSMTSTQVTRFLNGVNASVTPYINETEEGFWGNAAAVDIEVMLQLLYLLITAPQVDDPAFRETIDAGNSLIALAETDPGWQELVARIEARYGDSDWFDPIPSPEALETLTPEALLDLYRRRLGDVDDLVVAVVGDVDPETVGQLARRYVGSLPAGEADTYLNRRPSEPAGVVRRDVVLTPDSAATGLTIHHEALIDVNATVEVVSDVLTVILNDRLLVDVREDIGASYTMISELTTQLTPEPTIRSLIVASGDPDRIDDIRAEILRIVEELATDGPTPQDLDQAIAVVGVDYGLIDNSEGLAVLVRRAHVDDDDLPTQQRRQNDLARVTATDIRNLAAELYDPHQRIEIAYVLG